MPPAAHKKRLYRKGRATYVGAYLDRDTQQTLMDHLTTAAGVQPPFEAPPGVEVCKRIGAQGSEVFIIINHTRKLQHLRLPYAAREHLKGQLDLRDLELAAYDVAVLTRVG